MDYKNKDLEYYVNLPWTFSVEMDKDDGKTLYIVRVKELPGVCTDNRSLEKAMDDIMDVIAGAIRLYIKQGDPIPEPLGDSN